MFTRNNKRVPRAILSVFLLLPFFSGHSRCVRCVDRSSYKRQNLLFHVLKSRLLTKLSHYSISGSGEQGLSSTDQRRKRPIIVELMNYLWTLKIDSFFLVQLLIFFSFSDMQHSLLWSSLETCGWSTREAILFEPEAKNNCSRFVAPTHWRRLQQVF